MLFWPNKVKPDAVEFVAVGHVNITFSKLFALRLDQMKVISVSFALIVLCLAVAPNIEAQSVRSDLPRVLPSTLLTELREKQEAEPDIAPQRLADHANERLAVLGFNYHIDPCDVESRKTEFKFPLTEYNEVFHVYPLTGGDGNNMQVMAKEPGDAPCGCSLDLPITRAANDQLQIVTDKGSVSISAKNKFLFEKVELVDATLRKTTRSWYVHSGVEPAAVSADGKTVYMDLEIESLLIGTSADGALRFVPRTSADIITKYVDLRRFPKDPDNDYLGFRQFTKGKVKYTLKFSHVCT